MPCRTKSDQDLNEAEANECEISLIKSFLLDYSNLRDRAEIQSSHIELMDRIFTLNERTKALLCRAVIEHFENLIRVKDSRELLYALFKSISISALIKLIKKLNMMNVSLSSSYVALIEMFDELNKLGKPEINAAILEYFNIKEKWEQLIVNKQGKYIPEYFMTTLFINDSTQLKLLFEIIETNFLEYSKTNFTTFLVQCYIETYKRSEVANIIIDIMPSLASSRNGVFVLISALKSFKDDSLYLIIDRIIELSVSFSKDQYASTIIECLFKNHSAYSTRKFIQTRSNCFLGKDQ